MAIDPNKTSDQAKLLLQTLEAWAKPKTATAGLIQGMHKLWQEIYRVVDQLDQPRLLLCCNGEKPRGQFRDANTLHRVDRKWVVVLMYGAGFSPELLKQQVVSIAPVFDAIEDLRDNVLRTASQVTMEPPIDYGGWSPVPNLAPSQTANPFLDGVMLEFSTANDIPDIIPGQAQPNQ